MTRILWRPSGPECQKLQRKGLETRRLDGPETISGFAGQILASVATITARQADLSHLELQT